MSLAQKHCVPCSGSTPALSEAETQKLLAQLKGWRLDQGHLTKTFDFEDFAEALAFTNKVGAVAEEEGHHPDLHLGWGKLRIELWTHAINGLSESDFILAAKCDEIPR